MQRKEWNVYECVIWGALVGLIIATLTLKITSEWQAVGWLLGGFVAGAFFTAIIVQVRNRYVKKSSN